jgi:hypothetical protein
MTTAVTLRGRETPPGLERVRNRRLSALAVAMDQLPSISSVASTLPAQRPFSPTEIGSLRKQSPESEPA